jgi:galactose mutarotase-like enzyme
MNQTNASLVVGLTFVATLGGLLFGYDTAVISGVVSSIDANFIDPLNLAETARSSLSGWTVSSALFGWPDRTVTMRATHCSCLQIYAPAGRDFFCLGPQTAASGALGRKPEQLTVIAPGERSAIRVQFSVGTI